MKFKTWTKIKKHDSPIAIWEHIKELHAENKKLCDILQEEIGRNERLRKICRNLNKKLASLEKRVKP